MKKETAEKILNDVEKGYDVVADKFSETRREFWPELEFIKDYSKNKDKVLDYGCGNGRLLETLKDKRINYVGVDVSQKLINIAKNKYPGNNIEFKKISSPAILPFEDEYFNTAYLIAVMHHIPGDEIRKKIINDIGRVVKPGGKIVVTVWNLWQARYLKYIFLNWINKIVGRSDLDWNDCYIPFSSEKNIFKRYHHAFTKTSLKKLFEKGGFLLEKCEVVKGKNIVLVVSK